MQVGQWLKEATKLLIDNGIDTARLDSLVLLEDTLQRDRSFVLTNPRLDISISQLNQLNLQLADRSKHIPLAYIRGKCEFFGRDFFINSSVLVPRPESEAIITILKNLQLGSCPVIIDIGTGSGVLAISAKKEIPEAQVFAIDIDKDCLNLARKNALMHNAKIEFIQGDLLKPVVKLAKMGTVYLVNLPYVPTKFKLNEAAKHEPKKAIFSGSDGLHLYRKFFTEVSQLETKPDFIICEALEFQHQELIKISDETDFKLAKKDGLILQFNLVSR